MTTLVNGIDIRYDDTGPVDAPTIIFIHGFPFNRLMWKAQAERLKGRCRVVTFDLRGHGESGIGDGEYSMELFASDLLGLMDALRIDKAIVCALSMGGYIALNAAENHPERFSALILCDTQCTADTAEGKQRRLAAIKAVREEGVENFADALMERVFAPDSLTAMPETVTAVREMVLATSPLSLERSLRAMRERDESCSKLPGITVPVLILVGEADKIAPPEAAAYLKENILHAHMEIIGNAAHLSNLENPDAFNAALEKFISAV